MPINHKRVNMQFVKSGKSSIRNVLLLMLFIWGQSCNGQNKCINKGLLNLVNGHLKMEINPESFSIAALDAKGTRYIISAPAQKEIISDLKQDATHILS